MNKRKEVEKCISKDLFGSNEGERKGYILMKGREVDGG